MTKAPERLHMTKYGISDPSLSLVLQECKLEPSEEFFIDISPTTYTQMLSHADHGSTKYASNV